MTFLPPGYEAPTQKGGNFLKLQDGANKFRILSDAITGYVYWTKENKPVRLKAHPSELPVNIRLNDEGKPDRVKHFWAFVVWNYDESAIQIAELTQSTIQTSLTDLLNSEDWGDPRGYDITVNRKGEKLNTEYTVQPSPHREVNPIVKHEYEKMQINLNALYDGGNPFEAQEIEPTTEHRAPKTQEEADIEAFDEMAGEQN